MSSGWGCQYLTKNGIEEEWCRRLKHKCKPGCNGCILDGRFIFSTPDLTFNTENRKIDIASVNIRKRPVILYFL